MATEANPTLEQEQTILDAYKQMVINEEEPINPYTISERIGITEKEFFAHFSSAEDVGRKIWNNLGDEVIKGLNESEEVQGFSSLNKILSYYFTFFEIALAERSFIDITIGDSSLQKGYKTAFKEYMNEVVQEGIAMEEIQERFSLSNYYPDMLWVLHQRLLHYWLNDTSENFQETERAIEIFSKLPFDFMRHNILDSFVETAKFSFERFRKDGLNNLNPFN